MLILTESLLEINLSLFKCRCQVLLKTPPIKADLMELRVKDLQRYLMSNKISTKDCVGKFFEEKFYMIQVINIVTNDPSKLIMGFIQFYLSLNIFYDEFRCF